jgi:hypothetical protein
VILVAVTPIICSSNFPNASLLFFEVVVPDGHKLLPLLETFRKNNLVTTNSDLYRSRLLKTVPGGVKDLKKPKKETFISAEAGDFVLFRGDFPHRHVRNDGSQRAVLQADISFKECKVPYDGTGANTLPGYALSHITQQKL